MKQDRFLLIILTCIGLLMILSIAIFFIRNKSIEYKADNTPSNIVHNFVAAIYQHDYEKAYTYLADDPNKPDFEKFRAQYTLNGNDQSRPGVEILSENIDGETAIVQINFLQSAGGPFASSYRNDETARLIKQSNQWKIIQMPYIFWQYEWYQTPVKQ
jgi:hypothetical protein